MDELRNAIQSYLKKHYSPAPLRHTERNRIVTTLKADYKRTPRAKRLDNLVPFANHCVLPIPIGYNGGTAEYYILYRWNVGTDGEFANAPLRNAVVQQGVLLDRLGAGGGTYCCPVPTGRKPYSAAERALPYYFLETSIEHEPSYHRYRVLKDISAERIIEEINRRDDVFRDSGAKRIAIGKVLAKGVMFGSVAPVKPFRKQGYGYGLQYRFPISAEYLVRLGFLERER